MVLDSTLADSKIRGDDFVRMSGQDEVHDLTLSRREICEGRSDVILPPFRLFRLLTRFERPHDGRQQFSAVWRDCVRRPCSEGFEDRWPDAASFDQDPPRTAMLNQLLVISVALSGVVGEHENDDQIGTFIGEGRCPDFGGAGVGGEGLTVLALFLVPASSKPTFTNSAFGPDRRICVNPGPHERFCLHNIAPNSRARASNRTAGREFGSFDAVLSASRNRKVEIMSEGPVPKGNSNGKSWHNRPASKIFRTRGTH